MSAPIVPPRPTRASGNGPTAVKDSSIPQVPPRPTRKIDPSPVREEHTRSPFNEPYHSPPSKRRSGSHLATTDVPPRPPSVSLPSVGQEGSEYASFDQLPPEAHGVSTNGSETSPQQTVNVSANTPFYQPTASVPQSFAKSRISTVTRTDSAQAAAAGIGKARPDDDVHRTPADSTTSLSRAVTRDDDLRRVPSADTHPLRQQVSNNRSTSRLRNSRPGSVHEFNDEYEHEHGIPEIGMQVPLHANAGDVQAPSPAPGLSQHTPGVGFFNDGSTRAHTRRRSGKQQFGPPDSYGLHGHHGYSDHHDQFERDWCAKHPEQAAKEGYNVYGNLNTPRPEHALSTEELNRLVNQSSEEGMGTNANMIGTPTHEIAFNATQEYTSRMNSPRPSPAVHSPGKKRPSSGSQPVAESPLRKSFPFHQGQGDDAIEDDDTIHVDESEFRANKVTGGGPQDGAIDLGPRAGNTAEEGGWFDERGDGMPILASDEVIKRPGSAYMQPAVPPEPHHDDDFYDSDSGRPDSRRGSLRVPSRPSSRPNSMHGEYHGGNLYRFMSHEDHHGSGMGTPLEEIEEYEPLFPEDEAKPKPKPKQLQRPGLEHHHFPSQDIWEDAPSSVHYSTTVQTPEPPPDKQAIAPPPSKPSAFETPEQEQKRKEQNPEDMLSDNKTFVKPHFKAGVVEDMHRPGVQRFPSQDIWEDTPDSMRLVTTVSAPQMDDAKSPPDERPTTSAIPTSQDDSEARATTGFSPVMRRPSVPSRPHRRSKLAEEITEELQESRGKEVPDLGAQKQVSPDKAKAPEIPARPKPTVPTRPARPSRSVQNEGAPLAKSESVEEQAVTDAAPAPKVKPAVPARPGGEKIAALKSGFMADLNNRLKIGPREAAPKVKEPEDELSEEAKTAPLADSRKGRTKGPARRKPASSPSAAAAAAPIAADQTMNFSMSTPMTLWSIDESDELQVPGPSMSPPAEEEKDMAALERVLSANEAANTEEPPLAQPTSPEASRQGSLSAHAPGAIGHEGDEPEPTITPETVRDQKAIAPELETALKNAEGAPRSAQESPQMTSEANVVKSQIDPEVGRDAATVREKAPEEMNINGPEV